MATYITLASFTGQGITNIKESTTRLDAARKALAPLGVDIKAFYLTMGRYDLVSIVDAPDDATDAKALLLIGAQGNVSTETLKAFEEDEYRDIIGALP